MDEDLENLVHFYSTRKKDFPFNLKDADLMLKFETYFELKTMNVMLFRLLGALKVTTENAQDYYYEQLYKCRLGMFGEIDNRPDAAAAFLENDEFHKAAQDFLRDYIQKNNPNQKK